MPNNSNVKDDCYQLYARVLGYIGLTIAIDVVMFVIDIFLFVVNFVYIVSLSVFSFCFAATSFVGEIKFII